MTNKIEAWAVVRTDGTLMQTYNSESAALSAAIKWKAQSVSTTKPEDYRVVRLVEETQPEEETPKVKMTQAEFDEFKDLFDRGNVYFFLSKVIEHESQYPNLFKRLVTATKKGDDISQIRFAKLYQEFDPEHPEKTVEVERKKKWFVRSKGFTRGNYTYSKIDRSGTIVHQTFEKSDAMSFDTQEEAEKWVNPLNEAVLLEVEE